jgi:hypothetical protein
MTTILRFIASPSPLPQLTPILPHCVARYKCATEAPRSIRRPASFVETLAKRPVITQGGLEQLARDRQLAEPRWHQCPCRRKSDEDPAVCENSLTLETPKKPSFSRPDGEGGHEARPASGPGRWGFESLPRSLENSLQERVFCLSELTFGEAPERLVPAAAAAGRRQKHEQRQEQHTKQVDVKSSHAWEYEAGWGFGLIASDETTVVVFDVYVCDSFP